jgi:hypothetical protein
MIRYRMATLIIVLGTILNSYAQSGPAGDSHVVVTDGGGPADQPMLVPVSIGNRTDSRYTPGPLDSTAWALEYKVEDVREMWLKSDKHNAAEVNTVQQSALEAADALSKISDGQLQLGGLIIKDEYACFGYVIAGANTTAKAEQRTLAKKAERYCKSAALQLSKADDPRPGDSNAQAVKEWESRGEEHPRIAYLLAMSKCLEATSSVDDRLKVEAVKILSSPEIPAHYLDRYPPREDYVLHMCVTH